MVADPPKYNSTARQNYQKFVYLFNKSYDLKILLDLEYPKQMLTKFILHFENLFPEMFNYT